MVIIWTLKSIEIDLSQLNSVKLEWKKFNSRPSSEKVQLISKQKKVSYFKMTYIRTSDLEIRI